MQGKIVKINNLRGGQNSLNTIRLIAALQVLYGHTLTHLQINMPDVVSGIFNFFDGVPIFFTLSGFLIWDSVGRSKTFKEYAKKRFWRIYPELWMAVAVEILVLLILYKQPVNWSQMGLFTIGQTTIFQFWTPEFLRGYGCGTPNGALWTICVLIQFYFLVYFIYRLMHGRKMVLWFFLILFSILVGWITPFVQAHLGEIVGKIYGVTLIPFFWMFIIAAFVAEYKDRILPYIKKYWIIPLITALIAYITKIDIKASYNVLFTLSIFVGLLGASYTYQKLNINRDVSYGVYIYHMTFVNAFIQLGLLHSKLYLLAIVMTTLFAAYISTVTIGEWGLKRKYS